MALELPKITYIPVAGGAVLTLLFQRPPRRLAAYNRAAVRHDNVSTAGAKEVVVERVDDFLELEMEFVGKGSDVDAWNAFMAEALQGIEFNYFPDQNQADYTTYTLEDTDWKAGYQVLANYSFSVKFRKVIA
jgi:hypothetical protein